MTSSNPITLDVLITFGDKEGISFEVPSSTEEDETYIVSYDMDTSTWLCTCPGCLKGRHLCRHILACIDFMKFINMSLLDDPTVFIGGVSV